MDVEFQEQMKASLLDYEEGKNLVDYGEVFSEE